MNAPANIVVPDTNGTRTDRGWFAGRVRMSDQIAAIFVPPLAERAHPKAPLCEVYDFNKDSLSFFDGHANTLAWAKMGSKLAQFALDHGLIIPARDQLELVYRTFKPTTAAANQFYSGLNASSVPPGYPYTKEDTLQTTVEEFREGGPEAIPADWVWSSTQGRGWPGHAVVQGFGDGDQVNGHKSNLREVVLLRSIVIR